VTGSPQPAQPVATRPPLPAAANVRYIHSDIFDRLVNGPEDLTGLVAYGIYQQRKRQWMTSLAEEGRQPSEDELKSFARGFQDSALASLKDEAAGTLFRFSSSVMDARMTEMTDNAFNQRALNELNTLNSKIDHISGYKHHIVGHVAGFVVLVLLTFIFSVAITREPHLSALVSSIFSKQEATPH